MMESGDILNRDVRAIIAAVLRVPPDAPNLERSLQERWDSLKHIEIVFALEDRFGVEFSEREIPTLSTPEAITRLLRKRNAS